MNRRSYTCDGEIDIVMVDGALSNGARKFARDYRKELWGEHLHLTSKSNQQLLEDYKLALGFWLNPPKGAHIQPYLHNEEDFLDTPIDIVWDHLIDPDGRTVIGEQQHA